MRETKPQIGNSGAESLARRLARRAHRRIEIFSIKRSSRLLLRRFFERR